MAKDNKKYDNNLIETYNSFSGSDMVAMIHITSPNGNKDVYSIGSLQTLTYSIHMDRKPIRSIGNINAKDYVTGPRTIAGSLIFAVFNKHFAYAAMDNIKKSEYSPKYAFLADELPPFDITVSFANEYGAKGRLVLYGIRLVNEGQVMSINDIYTENTYQFVATDIEYLTDVNSKSQNSKLKNGTSIGNRNTESKKDSGKDITSTLKDNRNPKVSNNSILLKAKVHTPVKEDKKGTVKFSIEPPQNSGNIIITSNNLIEPIYINMARNSSIATYVALDPGKYKAVFEDVGGLQSNEKLFEMIYEYKPPIKYSSAPLVESVTQDAIYIYSNDITHTKVICKEFDNPEVIIEKSINARRSIINDLSSGVKYTLYTCDDAGKSESVKTSVTTLLFNSIPYGNLKDFIFINKQQLEYPDKISIYNAIVDQAIDIAKAKDIYFTMSDAILAVKIKTETSINNLNASDFTSYDLYQAELDRMNSIISICLDLISMANKLTNDYHFANNKNSIVLSSPAPEMIDFINCVFILDKDTKGLEFFKKYENIVQFHNEVKSISFYQYEEDKLAYRYIGKPGMKHYVVAYDELGQRSPKVEFYIPTDAEKAKLLESNEVQQATAIKTVINSRQDIDNDLSRLKLDHLDYKRMLIQNAKKPLYNILPPPAIISSSEFEIKVDVNYKNILGDLSNRYYIAIADMNDALLQRYFYKIPFTSDTSEVIFTTDNHGIKPNNRYILWIEDENCNQISECTSTMTHSLNDEKAIDTEEKISIFLNNKLINSIKKQLYLKINASIELQNIIDSIVDDTSVNEKNVFDRLINGLISYTPRLPDLSNIIEAIIQTKVDLFYNSDQKFFNNIYFDRRSSKFIISKRNQSYMINIIYINVKNQTQSFSNIIVDENIEYQFAPDKNKGDYAVINFCNNDIYIKSGTIFFDIYKNEPKVYKMTLGGL